MVGVAFGLGFIIGPTLGGLLGQIGTRVPFFVSAGLCMLNWLYGYFILPESLPQDHRRKFEWKRANPFGAFKHFKKYPTIYGLLGSLILVYLSMHAVQSTWTYFTMYKFDWSKAMVGASLGFVGLMIAIVQGGFIRIIIPKLGQHKSVYIGLLMYSLGYILFAFATRGWMMFAFLVPYAFGGIAGPAIQGIISTQVPPNEQGELQGGLTSLMSATTIIGPPLMTWLFAWFTKPSTPYLFPGAPFVLGALLTFASSLLAYKSFKKEHI
jgi:DHA1 family tetracycline resistance protein-like MFS transporter